MLKITNSCREKSEVGKFLLQSHAFSWPHRVVHFFPPKSFGVVVLLLPRDCTVHTLPTPHKSYTLPSSLLRAGLLHLLLTREPMSNTFSAAVVSRLRFSQPAAIPTSIPSTTIHTFVLHCDVSHDRIPLHSRRDVPLQHHVIFPGSVSNLPFLEIIASLSAPGSGGPRPIWTVDSSPRATLASSSCPPPSMEVWGLVRGFAC